MDKRSAQGDIIVWAVSQVVTVISNAMEVNIIAQVAHTAQRMECKQIPVLGNVSLVGIANLEVHHRKKLSVDMDYQFQSIAQLALTRRKRM